MNKGLGRYTTAELEKQILLCLVSKQKHPLFLFGLWVILCYTRVCEVEKGEEDVHWGRQAGLAGGACVENLKDREKPETVGKGSYVVFYCIILWVVPPELYSTETLEIRGMTFTLRLFQIHPPILLVDMHIGTAAIENRMAVPQKTKNRVTIWSHTVTSGNICGEKYNWKR